MQTSQDRKSFPRFLRQKMKKGRTPREPAREVLHGDDKINDSDAAAEMIIIKTPRL